MRIRSWWRILATLALDTVGLAVVARLTHEPLWALALPLKSVIPAARWAAARRRGPQGTSAALDPNGARHSRRGSGDTFWRATLPLGLAYGVAVARIGISLVARDAEQAVPEPWGSWLDLNLAMALAVLWTLLLQADARLDLGRVVGGLTVVWALVAYVAKRTHGATGSDPFAYVQMAVDIATHGSPLHTFRLAEAINKLGVSIWPIVPVGYSVPDPVTLTAYSVWPPGYAALLAGPYKLMGESALYLTTPLLGVATLGATWWLTCEVLETAEPWRTRTAAGLAVLVLATSFQQIDHLLVPLADIPAQLFTVLAVACTLRAARRGSLLVSLASGLCLGIAFTLRYTQVLVAVPMLIVWARAVARDTSRARRAMLRMVCSGVVAVISVAPVFVYHAVVLGNPFAVESRELQLFAAENVLDSLLATLADLMQPNEFLLLFPFGALGALDLWRRRRWNVNALATWIAVIIGFHLPYAALRTRDVLSVFPVLAVLVGAGMAVALDAVRTNRMRHAGLVGALIIGTPIWLRSAPTLESLGAGARYTAFGYLQADQRQAFSDLAGLTPSDALIAATLNSGPVMLYAQRDAVRPGAWTTSDWRHVVAETLAERRRIFVLDDGEDMARPLADLRETYRLNARAQLSVPYFSVDAGSTDRAVALIEITRLDEGAFAPLVSHL